MSNPTSYFPLINGGCLVLVKGKTWVVIQKTNAEGVIESLHVVPLVEWEEAIEEYNKNPPKDPMLMVIAMKFLIELG